MLDLVLCSPHPGPDLMLPPVVALHSQVLLSAGVRQNVIFGHKSYLRVHRLVIVKAVGVNLHAQFHCLLFS